ncbi:nitric oxide synthase oxygenase [Deinococcus aerophilus]
MPASPLLEQAEDFLRLYHREVGYAGGQDGLEARLETARSELTRTGHYTLTPGELTHGARVAWRNSARCVGRLPWRALEVRDLRHATHPDEVFAQLLAHLHGAFNGGRIRPVISVFGPGVRIHNPQLIRYAGYPRPDGGVVGDPENVALTDHLRRLGWGGGPGSPFDVLPLAIEAGGEVQLYDLPAEAIHEVPLTHPDCPALGALGLKWHALPVISDMALEIGGLDFACAPFNGWYLETEIAARNLADQDRYNQLPAVARALGLDTSRARTLWQDRALVELNVAALHSFDAAGVRLSDHHAATRQFVRFEEEEARAGRAVRGRWSWLVPPLSPATTPVWHRHYEDGDESPRFVRGQAAWVKLQRPERGCPFH